ncbi:MAG TPA: glycosyltransferase family 39 protein [Thermoanaerobaculia bacterium]|nr:glycosyltransferase family 39 protein [Thermoanaerobaculia bacterium]
MKRDWTFIAAIAALALIAVVRVASTHRVFSATLDEPIHLASGYEWLHGEYALDVTHPPLARIFCALPVVRFPEPRPTNMIDAGNQLLYHDNRYVDTLAAARRGNLVLLILATITVAAWARRHFSRATAIVATALFTSVPAILGHAGLITTDLSVAATLPLALLALDLFLESPSAKRAVFLGVAISLGALSKLSFFVYFAVCVVVWSAATRVAAVKSGDWRRRTPHVIVIAFVIVWAGYHFDFGPPEGVTKDVPNTFQAVGLPRWLASMPMPAPAIPVGFAQVKLHDLAGHTAYLLGETSRHGWWYYFPVVFFFKTPIPLLILAAWALVFRDKRVTELLLLAAAIMLTAMTASLNIGLRHILPIYAPLSIVAAYAVVTIWQRARDAFGRATLAALLAWLFIGVAVEHPDYLAWFNEAARPDPARVAVDSNLDWGQDVLRLAEFVRARRIEHLWIVMNNATRLDAHGIRAVGLPPRTPVTGWIAVGENWLAFSGDEYDWLRVYRPVRRIGKSIRVYRIP